MSDTLHEYTAFLRDTSWYQHAGEENAHELAYLTLGLVGESGEFADAFKKVIRETGFNNEDMYYAALIKGDEPPILKLVGELGDVLWYVTRICVMLDITLEQLAAMNTYKLHERLIAKGIYQARKLQWPFTDPRFSLEELTSCAERLASGR